MSSKQIDKNITQWVNNWLISQAQRMGLHQASRVPQGSILGPVLFNVFINDLDVGLEGVLSKFADDTKLRETVDFAESGEALQRDLDKSESYPITNCMKFNKRKYWVLCLGRGNPGYTYRLGDEMLESSPAERDVGVLTNSKLNMIALPYAALVWLHLKDCVKFEVPQDKKDIELLANVQRRSTRMVKGMEGKT